MDKEQFLALIQKYLAGEATLEEEQLLLNFYGSFQDSDIWDETTMGVREKIEAKMLGKIQSHIARTNIVEKSTVKLWPRIAVAAAAVAAIVIGVWFFNYRGEIASVPRNDAAQNDIAPGKNGATITLANGKVIQLSDAKTGVVVGSDLKYNDGAPVQGGGPDLRQDDDRFNEMQTLTASTAKGQTYQFTLPDGTKVWLNADSKISFPSQFSGKERKILLDGEGYFEVSKDKSHPFIVAANNQQIKVLGTHFNINGYKDETWTVTTLLEGSVQVDTKLDRKVLRPGQQSIGDIRGLKVKEVDVDEVVSWKSGKFSFASEEIGNIMKQVSRWYDVDVNYTDDVEKIKISGSVSRFANISVLLQKLEQTGLVHFKVEGRKIIVSKGK